jgi:hypothetical protein
MNELAVKRRAGAAGFRGRASRREKDGSGVFRRRATSVREFAHLKFEKVTFKALNSEGDALGHFVREIFIIVR